MPEFLFGQKEEVRLIDLLKHLKKPQAGHRSLKLDR